MPIDPKKQYETHRPKDLGSPEMDESIQRLLSKREWNEFVAHREEAGTAGPIMVGGHVAAMPGDELEKLFQLSQEKGARPCRIDEETGQVHLGHYVFVPKKD